MTIFGAALHPDYSHVSDTVSELFAPGAPNKPLLDLLHTLTVLLTTIFGIGVVRLVRSSEDCNYLGLLGGGLIIATGLVNMATATVFPQDVWNSTATFAGEMYIILIAVLELFSIVFVLILGIWFKRSNVFPGFGAYSLITLGFMVLTGAYALTKVGTPLMGLSERIAIFTNLQWSFVLACKMYRRTNFLIPVPPKYSSVLILLTFWEPHRSVSDDGLLQDFTDLFGQ